MRQFNILAISGSLRSNSANIHILNYVASLTPENINFSIYQGLRDIPPFDDSMPSEAVVGWREAIRNADGIFICTPEYAFGVSGVLKNALDWTVSSGDLDGKPIALITAATGGEKAHAALLPTLNVISGNSVITDASFVISFVRAKMNEAGEITDKATAEQLKAALNELIKRIAG